MSRPVVYSCIPQDQILLDPAETARRLKTERGYTNETILTCESNLRNVLDCKYSAVRVPIAFPGEDCVDFAFTTVHSHSLYRNLSGCREAFLFAVTTGINVDRLLIKLNLTSASEAFITDALASAFAEAVCDFAENELKGNLACRPRFSPGYGDLPLSVQPTLLDAVDAQRLLGITLSKSLLMTPKKSITAIMGIKDE